MNHATISTYFNLSLFIGLPLGLLLIVLWARRVHPPLVRSIERQGVVNLHAVAIRGTPYNAPGIIAFILCALPALYFNYLLKQHDYCSEVVKVNKGIAKNDADLQARCGRFDIEALFERSKNPP